MTSPDLEAAFRATAYRVFTDLGHFDLRIDVSNAAFDAVLFGAGVSRWAVVTACNPMAVRCGDADNARRHRRLQERLVELDWRCLPARNIADDQSWPDEPACLICQIEAAGALELATEFDQRAFVYGEIGFPPKLIWTHPI